MALAIPALVRLLLPLIALILAMLARTLAAPIINLVSTGFNWFDRGIAWLTNKAIDLAIEWTKALAPAFIEGVEGIVSFFHVLGQLSFYNVHALWRTATTFASFSHWIVHSFIPRQLRAVAHLVGDTTIVKVSKYALSKAQILDVEHHLEAYVRKAIGATIPGVVPKAWPRVNWTPKHWREWLGLGAVGGALALPGTLAWEKLFGRRVNRELIDAQKRLRRLEKILGATGAAAIVTYGLAKIGLGWMTRCKNLRGIGKSFCGADLASMVGLLGGLIALEEGFGLEDFAKLLLAVEEPVVNGILAGISDIPGANV